MLATILARCGTETEWEEELAEKVADVYVSCTRGLGCLCRYPTYYKKERWDLLIKYGRECSHFWFAHVAPLYALMFLDLQSQEGLEEFMQLTGTFELEEAATKPLQDHVTIDSLGALLKLDGVGCPCFIPQTTVPVVVCLQKHFFKLHGINLAEKLGQNSWILSYAQVMAQCAQLRSTFMQPSFKRHSCAWLQNACKTIMDRYGSYSGKFLHYLPLYQFYHVYAGT